MHGFTGIGAWRFGRINDELWRYNVECLNFLIVLPNYYFYVV